MEVSVRTDPPCSLAADMLYRLLHFHILCKGAVRTDLVDRSGHHRLLQEDQYNADTAAARAGRRRRGGKGSWRGTWVGGESSQEQSRARLRYMGEVRVGY